MSVLGKELPSEESRALKCCAPNLFNKKDPGTHIIYEAKMKRRIGFGR